MHASSAIACIWWLIAVYIYIYICVCMWFQVDRYTRRLDQELSKFKMELEADNAGITEMLEKRNNLMLELEMKMKRQRSCCTSVYEFFQFFCLGSLILLSCFHHFKQSCIIKMGQFHICNAQWISSEINTEHCRISKLVIITRCHSVQTAQKLWCQHLFYRWEPGSPVGHVFIKFTTKMTDFTAFADFQFHIGLHFRMMFHVWTHKFCTL